MNPIELLDLIKKRRSIRVWSDRPIEEEKIHEILTAGIYAPSACNSQKTRFFVVRDKELVAQITRNSPPHFSTNCPNKVIVVLFDLEKPHPLAFDFKKKHPLSRFIWQDTAAAMMNMMLMAEALDLKTCWVTASPQKFGNSEKKIRQLLGVSRRYEIASLLFVGYSNHLIDINVFKHYGVPIKRSEQEGVIEKF